ncbi:hypothetical protein BCR39DRAFT_512897 [Naematelia encephala]|uniref:Uncharacterized protein n=1 Tax=Naematelia encephala TaxID=71784 RepID=A0A1Y2BMB6_9TREE|nr:hypothetical protein BCR39DRAFT_512897 [Naematelia encephala]
MPPPQREDERSWDARRDKAIPAEERYREQQKRSGEGSSTSTGLSGLPRRPSSPAQKTRSPSKGSEEYGSSRPRSPAHSLSDIYRRLETRRREDSAEPGQIVSPRRSRSPDIPPPRRDSNPIPRIPSPSSRARPMRSRSPSRREQEGASSRGHTRDGTRKRIRSRSRSPGGDGGGRRRIRSRSRSSPGGGRRRLRSPRSRSPPRDGGILKGEPGSVVLGLEGFTK